MKKILLLLFSFMLAAFPAFGFEPEGVWEAKHLVSQKFSVGEVRDLYPPEAAWSGELLIFGIQFLNNKMGYLHCDTPSRINSDDYPVYYSIKKMKQKTELTFILENEDEIIFYVFDDVDGKTFFSYSDAGPEPGGPSSLLSSTNKIVFRNHIGCLDRIE